MRKFNEVAQTILREETDTRQNVFREISGLLSQKGIKAFEQDEILKAVQNAIHQAYKEGYKAAEQNPFK